MRLQLGFPHRFSLIAPQNYYQFITLHGMIMVIYLLTALFSRRFRQLPHSFDVRCARHGVSILEHGELLGVPARRAGLVAGFFVPAGDRRPVGPCILRKPFSPARPARDGESLHAGIARLFIVAFTMGGQIM